MNDEVVDRLYQALVEELRRRGHPEDRPVRVSELYQSIVPYRAVRSILGVDLNADYEHALLRLLAGERDLLHLDSAEARTELRREVESPYPDVGLFRKFSGSEVQVSWHAANQTSDPQEPPVERDEGRAPVRLEPGPGPRPVPDRARVRLHESEEDAAPRSAPVVGARSTGEASTGEASTGEASTGAASAGACLFCGEALPADRLVHFCPYCGGDQGRKPCTHCDATLERGWRYCISCGHPG